MSPRAVLAIALTLGFVASPPALRADDAPTFVIEKTDVPSPASASAYIFNPRFARSPDGTLYLTWLEADLPASPRVMFACFSRYLPARRAWSPRAIAATLPDDSDSVPFYAFAAGPDHRLALLHATRNSLAFTTSADDDATWSQATPLDLPAGHTPRPAALQFLPDGRLLAAWLNDSSVPPKNSRPGTPPAPPAALYIRFLDADLKSSPAQLIESPVSPLSFPDLVSFPDGGALVAWRGLSADGTQDIRTARFDDGKWQPPSTLNPDNWQPAAAPADGPVLASRGAHLAAAWFTATDNPRLNVSTSASAGTIWLSPSRVDDVAPLGRPSLVMLDDNSILVSWIEQGKTTESLFLRRIAPFGSLSVPVRLAENITGHPRLALVKDNDDTPAQLLVAYTHPAPADCCGTTSLLMTTLITLPDPASLTEPDLCGCNPTPEELRGYPIRGKTTVIDPKAGTVTVAHDAIPGIMKAATTRFLAESEILADLKPGQRLLGRIERRGSDWWFFSPRTLVKP